MDLSWLDFKRIRGWRRLCLMWHIALLRDLLLKLVGLWWWVALLRRLFLVLVYRRGRRREVLSRSRLSRWLLGWMLVPLLRSLFLNRVYRRRGRNALLRRLSRQRMNRLGHKRRETLLALKLWRRSKRRRDGPLRNRLGSQLLGRRRQITLLYRFLERIRGANSRWI